MLAVCHCPQIFISYQQMDADRDMGTEVDMDTDMEMDTDTDIHGYMQKS